MNKTIIAAFSALAILVPNAMRADEPAKEYNMVITLQNGTTITLGHNDIKNITFDGEEISISGNVVNTIEEIDMRTRENRDLIDMNRDLINSNTEMLEGQNRNTQEMLSQVINLLNAGDEELRTHIAYLQDEMDALALKIEESGSTDVSDLKADIAALSEVVQTRYDELLSRHYMNEERINMALTMIDDNSMRIRDLEDYVKSLHSIIEDMRAKLEM